MKEKVNPFLEKKEEIEKCFFTAWKKGIKLVGQEYFKIQDDLEAATNKWDLIPNKDLIECSLPQIGNEKAILLVAMYSFYTGEDVQIYLKRLDHPNIYDVVYTLNKEYLEVISELYLNYCGWQ